MESDCYIWIPVHFGSWHPVDTVLVGDEFLVWSGIYAPGVGQADGQCVEVKKGVFFRKESTIPLNRITDLRLHDGPLMRHYGLRGLKVETAGSGGGQYASSEGDLIGVIDAEGFRNAVLEQRQRVIKAETGQAPAVAAASAPTSDTLVEIRDILTRIESHLAPGDND